MRRPRHGPVVFVLLAAVLSACYEWRPVATPRDAIEQQRLLALCLAENRADASSPGAAASPPDSIPTACAAFAPTEARQVEERHLSVEKTLWLMLVPVVLIWKAWGLDLDLGG
jgi:hypothetical protein